VSLAKHFLVKVVAREKSAMQFFIESAVLPNSNCGILSFFLYLSFNCSANHAEEFLRPLINFFPFFCRKVSYCASGLPDGLF
jgi:hypothetical protein